MSTTAYTLSSILGAQLRSVIDAEVENAEAITEYITRFGFEKEDDGPGLGKLRMLSFQMQRRNEEGALEWHTIDIPLLSILPVPMLSVEKADFEFSLQVREVLRETHSGSENNSGGNAVRSSNVGLGRLVTSFAKSRRHFPSQGSTSYTKNTQTDGNMSVKISLGQTDFPLGVEKLLGLSELGITDTTEENDE